MNYETSALKLATPQTKEVITDASRSSVWILWTPRRESRTGRDRTTPVDCDNAVRSPRYNSPFLIGGTGVPPTRGHSGSLEVLNKLTCTSPSVSKNTQKFDACVDGNLENYGDSTSILSKVIGLELLHSTSTDIYLRCRMDFTSNAVRNEAPNFVDLGLPNVNASDEFNSFGNPATRFRRLTD